MSHIKYILFLVCDLNLTWETTPGEIYRPIRPYTRENQKRKPYYMYHIRGLI